MSAEPLDADMVSPTSQQSLKYLTPSPPGLQAEFNQLLPPPPLETLPVQYFNPAQSAPASYASQAAQPAAPQTQILDEGADLWGDDVSSDLPCNAHLPCESEDQISESLPVFAATLSTLAAFLTEPMVMHRIWDLVRQTKEFDNTITSIFNNLRSLVNQWNNTVDDKLAIQRSVSAPSMRSALTSNAAPATSHAHSTPPVIHPTHTLSTTQRPFRVGDVPTHYTVQSTLPFTTASKQQPPPIPMANRPAPSYAQAVKSRPANTLLNITSALATAMPDAPARALLTMATKMIPAPSNRAVPRHAPHNTSKVITVKPSSGNVSVSEIPNDEQLLSAFSLVYEEAKMENCIPQYAPEILFVRWLNNALHLQFRSSPCNGTEAVDESFWTDCPGLSSAILACSKFCFCNGVLYRRVPFSNPSTATTDESIQQIKEALLGQYAWEGVTMIGNPRVQISEGSSFGTVFVDFYNSSTS